MLRKQKDLRCQEWIKFELGMDDRLYRDFMGLYGMMKGCEGL